MLDDRLEISREQAFLDHLAAGGAADPLPFYARLREEQPVFWTPTGFWFITRYDLAEAYYRGDTDKDSLWTKQAAHARLNTGQGAITSGDGYAAKFFSLEIHARDGENHARLRRLMNKPFRPRAVNALTESINGVVSELIDGLEDSGNRAELVKQFALQIPTRVIMDLLGMPLEHVDLMTEIASSVIESHEPGAENWMDRADKLFEQGHHVLLDLIEARRSAPKDDVLTQYATFGDRGEETMSDVELTMNLMFLLVAGHETTANVIGTTIHQLLTNPDQLALLRSDPGLTDCAVEEALRFRAPVRMASPRWALTDMEIGGVRIAKGDEVKVSLTAVNHDPAVFSEPGKFLIERAPNRHMSFAPGATHFCLGAALARLETKCAIECILNRLPDLALDGETIWKSSFVVAGPEHLPVRW